MANKSDHLEQVLALVTELEKKGFQPVLIGGIALAILGSQRVTKDFDFLISRFDLAVEDLMDVFYKHGLELATKLNKQGEIIRTIDNPRVAAIKLKEDIPDSLFFFDWKTRLRIDLLLDFPLPAQEVALRAKKVKVRSHSLWIASQDDLIRLKEIAFADRKSPNDAQDLAFLKALRKGA